MRAEQQISLQPDRCAQLAAEALAALQIGQAQLPAIEGAVGPGGIEFQRREPLRQVLGGALGREIRIAM